MNRTTQRRGVSLIEVMVASAVLIIGLTGITAMLMKGAVNGRVGQQTMLSAGYGQQTIGEVTARGISSLVPQIGASFDAGDGVDGGYYVDGSGRQYQSAFIVTDLGLAWPTYRIDVETSFVDGAGVTRRTAHSTILSGIPDAG